MRAYVRRMRLLFDALLDGLPVRIADLRPAVMRRVIGRRIGVNHRTDAAARFNIYLHDKTSILFANTVYTLLYISNVLLSQLKQLEQLPIYI